MKILIIGSRISNPYLGPSVVLHNTLKGFIEIQKELINNNIMVTFLSLNDNVRKKISGNIDMVGLKIYPSLTFTGEIQFTLNKPKETFDIVHSHDIYSLLPYLVSKIPTVFTLHGIFWKEKKFAKNKFLAEYTALLNTIRLRLYYNRLSKFVAISPYVIDELTLKGFNTEKVVVIENPVSSEFFEVDKKECNMILYPATLKLLKNQLGFLKAVSLIKAELKDYRIVFAGSGDMDYYLKLRDFTKKNDLNAVFLGSVPYNKMLKLFSQASLTALISFQETLPMAILEALATGTPVITSNVGGLKYLIKNSFNGFLVNPNKPNIIAEKLLILIQDRGLRIQLGRNAKKDAERFRSENIAKKLLKLYMEIQRVSLS
ncbi:MAG: glycosyltransferase family 4 protein [Thermoproteota archaeon]|nr:glycosyltransferase family 4 protein [Candidatus Brockarchaeota archaeon]